MSDRIPINSERVLNGLNPPVGLAESNIGEPIHGGDCQGSIAFGLRPAYNLPDGFPPDDSIALAGTSSDDDFDVDGCRAIGDSASAGRSDSGSGSPLGLLGVLNGKGDEGSYVILLTSASGVSLAPPEQEILIN